MITDNRLYRQDLEWVSDYIDFPDGARVLITGATGLIGSFLMDAMIARRLSGGAALSLTGTSRHLENLQKRFGYAGGPDWLRFIERDAGIPIPDEEEYDFIIHLASNADPRSYALYPAETIITNMTGTLNVLNYARRHPGCRVLFTSTFEVYGEIPDRTRLSEEDYGLIDYNQIRSGYPESKRTAELLVRSFVEEYGADAVIARLSSIYGPTMTKGDNKAAAQFIRRAAAGQDIVLKSKGNQRRSYCYVADACAGILTALRRGKAGEAYNVCNPACEITIAELAQIAAKAAGTRVVFDLPDELEQKGFGKAKDSVLRADKLTALGYAPAYSAEKGITVSVSIIHDLEYAGPQG
ncbi:MAG: NAD-dependent epimerase/dehydratase family protein [Lachnospiraceae bacterium]|jgi:nucleoside-diphosphate-sugar epimerase|nr:NAD-dependent epimerase/dehydratase family protein [Lachnospiraceae bacterium]